jgi:hypothetical protein
MVDWQQGYVRRTLDRQIQFSMIFFLLCIIRLRDMINLLNSHPVPMLTPRETAILVTGLCLCSSLESLIQTALFDKSSQTNSGKPSPVNTLQLLSSNILIENICSNIVL